MNYIINSEALIYVKNIVSLTFEPFVEFMLKPKRIFKALFTKLKKNHKC